MADVAKTVSIIFQGQDQASAVSDKVAASMKTIGDSAGLSAKQIEQAAAAEEKWANSSIKAAQDAKALADAAKSTGDAAEKSAGQADRFVQTLKAIATAAVVKEFIDANSQLEKLTLGFTSVAGSTQGAAKEMDYVRDASERLGIKLTDAGGAYLKLAAATKGSALEGEGARTIFEAVAKQLALLGGSSADVSGALVQVAQGISKGKFELEDLKSIAERIPGFFDKFADSLGIATPALFKLIEQGKIGGPEFLKFAQTINTAIGGIDVDTFEAKAARASDAWDRFLVSVGKAGAFDAVKGGLDLAGYAAEQAGSAVQTFSGIVAELISTAKTGDIATLWERARDAINKAGAAGIEYEAKLFGINLAGAKVNETTAETARLARLASEAMVGNETDAETQRLLRQANAQQDAIKATEAALKTLGVESKKVNADLITAFETVAASSTATGKEIIAGFGAALKSATSIEDINSLGGALTKAYADGKVGADDFFRSTVELGKAQEKLLGPTNDTAAALKKQADEAKKAEENAAKLALELEKIASNERIKFMEFKVELDIAKLQEDTKRVQAAFDSINNTMNSTGDVISSALSMLKDFDSLDWGSIRIIEDQLAKENEIRRENFELQKRLTEAQIENLNAQSQQLEKGDALIKIDGAGLQPHLEAFMFEVLKAIQVRVSRDGLPFLLGV